MADQANAQQANMAPEGGGLTHSQMQANLTGAKEARKRAELDAQLLANRIALLKQEEEKAWKKIEETRKRAQEITSLRSQNAQNAYQREQTRKNREEVLRSHQDAKAAYVRNAKLVSQDNLMEKMEKEEMELIQRLQNTQTVQRNAFEELETALGQTAQQVSSNRSAGAPDRAA